MVSSRRLYGARTPAVFRGGVDQDAERQGDENATRHHHRFINEVARSSADRPSILDVLAAAPDQGEFPDVRAGAGRRALVSGRPYYLSHLAQKSTPPAVVLAGARLQRRWARGRRSSTKRGKNPGAPRDGLTFKETSPTCATAAPRHRPPARALAMRSR